MTIQDVEALLNAGAKVEQGQSTTSSTARHLHTSDHKSARQPKETDAKDEVIMNSQHGLSTLQMLKSLE